jgi:hypothetical protein
MRFTWGRAALLFNIKQPIAPITALKLFSTGPGVSFGGQVHAATYQTPEEPR